MSLASVRKSQSFHCMYRKKQQRHRHLNDIIWRTMKRDLPNDVVAVSVHFCAMPGREGLQHRLVCHIHNHVVRMSSIQVCGQLRS